MSELDAKWLELVAAGRAEWMPGMSTDGMTVVDADETGISIVRKETIQDHWAPKDAVPDWSDDATLGALLGQVRKRWKDDRISSVFNVVYGTWMLLMPDDAAPNGKRLIGCGPTEPEALLAVLECAP